MLEMEDGPNIYYFAWQEMETYALLRLRYDNGRRMRNGTPFPDYLHMCNTVVNRILSERGEM